MRASTVLLALFIGGLVYVLVGVPTFDQIWQDPKVTDAEKLAVADVIPRGPEKRKALLESAEWDVAPIMVKGAKVRVVRIHSKAEAKEFDRLYRFDREAKLLGRGVNPFGEQWKGRLAEVKWD